MSSGRQMARPVQGSVADIDSWLTTVGWVRTVLLRQGEQPIQGLILGWKLLVLNRW